jgi:uncharacterized membrane protein
MTERPRRAVVAFGFLLSALFYTRLPGPLLTGAFLIIGDWTLAPRALVAFALPTAALVTSFVLSRVWKAETVDDDSMVDETYRAIALIVVIFITALHALLLVGLSGPLSLRPWVARSTIVLFGLLLVGVGNLLPRTRPNLAFGIRTARTLADRALWMRINRVGGYVAVTMGLVIVFAGAFLTRPAMTLIVHVAGVAGLAAFVRSYRKQVRA